MGIRTEPITVETIRTLIAENIEPNEPYDTILAVLKEHDGKVFTKRIVNIMETRCPQYHIVYYPRDYTRSIDIRIMDKQSTPCYKDIATLILRIRSDSGPRYIDATDFESANAAYYSARRERNTQRREWLNSPEKIAKLAEDSEAMRLYLTRFQELYSRIWPDDGEATIPDYYAWRNLFGVELKEIRG